MIWNLLGTVLLFLFARGFEKGVDWHKPFKEWTGNEITNFIGVIILGFVCGWNLILLLSKL